MDGAPPLICYALNQSVPSRWEWLLIKGVPMLNNMLNARRRGLGVRAPIHIHNPPNPPKKFD